MHVGEAAQRRLRLGLVVGRERGFRLLEGLRQGGKKRPLARREAASPGRG